jgi:serine/threonine protein kinase
MPGRGIAMQYVKEEAPTRLFKQRYRLGGYLESGGLAEIYLADDLLFQRSVKVAIIYKDVAADSRYHEKLEAEARMAAALEHPNIARMIDWGYEHGMYFLVYEYVEGHSLAEIIAREGSIPPPRAARIAWEVAAALGLAHSRNLVHGGISPRNIMIDDTGQVKVYDFGMAWEASGRGYAQYISPEQVQRLSVDGRSDIYALGIVFYQMLTGRVPFDNPDMRMVAWRQLNQVAASPSVVDPLIPPSLSAITMKALSKNPELRYQTAQDMRGSLQQYLDGTPGGEVIPVKQRGSVPPWLWAIITLVALLAITGIILAIVLSRSPQVAAPNIIGMSEAQAQQALQQDGFNFKTQDQYITSNSQQVGVVVDQNPSPGSKIDKNSTVAATITRELRMPDVADQGRADAENTLRAAGINNIQETDIPVNDKSQVGNVVQQAPGANSFITPDTVVVLQIGQQSNLVIVPNVVDLDQNTAVQQLQTAGLQVSVVQQQGSTVPAGRVISESPAAGSQVDKDSTVVIVVSQALASSTP